MVEPNHAAFRRDYCLDTAFPVRRIHTHLPIKYRGELDDATIPTHHSRAHQPSPTAIPEGIAGGSPAIPVGVKRTPLATTSLGNLSPFYTQVLDIV